MSGLIPLVVGSVFAGAYKVLQPLSHGETRGVYLVEQVATGKVLVLKVLDPTVLSAYYAGGTDRFIEEVRAGSRIASEHVVDVRGAGVDDATGLPWLVTERLQGENLATVLERSTEGSLPQWDEVLTQLGRALAAAHAAGVMYGNLTPETIFLGIPGTGGAPFRVTLLDLGIPRVAWTRDRDETTRMVWLAPEQLEPGASVEPSTDVWTLGLLAFRMFTGKQYFLTANANPLSGSALRSEILTSQLEPASVRASKLGINTALPTSFDSWFARAVARPMAERYRNAIEAFDGLTDVLADVSGVGADVEDAAEGAERASAVEASFPNKPRTHPPPLPAVVLAIAQNPKPAIIAAVLLVLLALGAGLGLGAAFFHHPRGTAWRGDSPVARAHVWARGDREACERACERGDSVACHGLGLIYQYGIKVPRDDTRAAELYKKACEEGGDMAGCGSLAARYFDGAGVAEDRGHAAELYKKACDGEDWVSCVDLAEMAKNGAGIERNEALAKTLYQRACKGGLPDACGIP